MTKETKMDIELYFNKETLADWFDVEAKRFESATVQASVDTMIERYVETVWCRATKRYPFSEVSTHWGLGEQIYIEGDVEYWDLDTVKRNLRDIKEDVLNETHDWEDVA